MSEALGGAREAVLNELGESDAAPGVSTAGSRPSLAVAVQKLPLPPFLHMTSLNKMSYSVSESFSAQQSRQPMALRMTAVPSQVCAEQTTDGPHSVTDAVITRCTVIGSWEGSSSWGLRWARYHRRGDTGTDIRRMSRSSPGQ